MDCAQRAAPALIAEVFFGVAPLHVPTRGSAFASDASVPFTHARLAGIGLRPRFAYFSIQGCLLSQ